MTQAIVASFPVESQFVPGCLENIIDKRVSGIALNLLEQLVNWICSWIYCCYNSLFEQKIGRVYYFSDAQVRLFDCTKEGVASTMCEFEADYILLNGHKVIFPMDPNAPIVFSREGRGTHIDYVIVKDDPKKGPRRYQITMQEIDAHPMGISWKVNADRFRASSVVGGPKDSYLAKAI